MVVKMINMSPESKFVQTDLTMYTLMFAQLLVIFMFVRRVCHCIE